MNQQREISICDCTLQDVENHIELSFREKIELCRLIDKLGVFSIELCEIKQKKIDRLLIKSICSAVQRAVVSVPVNLKEVDSVQMTWEALKDARKARMQVVAPTSSVQMEYLLHLKPTGLTEIVENRIRECRALTNEVEFIAVDATRSDPVFLRRILSSAVNAGAKIVTLCDTAGILTPDETITFLKDLFNDLPELKEVMVGFSSSNELNLADACAFAAVSAGVDMLKAAAFRGDTVSLAAIVKILNIKGSTLQVKNTVEIEQINRITGQVDMICNANKRQSVAFSETLSVHDKDILLSIHDSFDTVIVATEKLGYDLGAEDQQKVWSVFSRIVEKKESITLKELDAIIAAEAMQVPPAYHSVQYVINTGNTISAMSHMKLMFHNQEIQGIASGDGAIDAAFNSIEMATGRHYELDDFQIQSVTEGREAMGETIVKLRHEGKLYSGRGISTDIVGAGIMAYINAVNKIVYEEEEA